MEIRIGIAKTAKWHADESADTAVIFERPAGGGYSIILCDGMINGQDSKNVSFVASNKISALISEGVRDSTAIRATSDLLQRAGTISFERRIHRSDYEHNRHQPEQPESGLLLPARELYRMVQ